MGISDSNSTYGLDQTKTADVLNDGVGVQGAITVTNTATEVKVGASPLENRKSVTVYNNGNQTIYWGYTNAVTTSTGTPIEKKQTVEFAVGDGQSIWLIASSGSQDVRITEAA
jgi:hypothetical protein